MKLMNRSLVIVALLVAAAFTLMADESAVQLEQANTLYRGARFKEAAALYEQIAANGYESPELWFNLGNARFKQNDIPGAIVSYERAKRLAPHDEDIAYNLRLANLRIVDKIEPLPQLFFVEWWRGFVSMMTADRWAVLTLAFWWVMAMLAGMVVMSRSFTVRRIAGILSAVLFLAGAIGFGAGMQRDKMEEHEPAAIVITPSVPVKSAPDAASTDLFVVHEGLKVEILDALGEWKKVRLADGKIGWMGEKTIVEI